MQWHYQTAQKHKPQSLNLKLKLPLSHRRHPTLHLGT
jgi:hypothetical protein